MGKLNAGALTERVTLLTTASVTPDGVGGDLPGAMVQKPVWAQVRQLSGKQLVSLGQELDQRAYAITIRYLTGVSAKQQLLYQGQLLSIQVAEPDLKREYCVLTCFDSGKYAGSPALVEKATVVFDAAFAS